MTRKEMLSADLEPMQPFTASEFDELKRLLGLTDRTEAASKTAYIVAMLIHEAALRVRVRHQLMRLGGGKSDLEEVGKIEAQARSLSRTLLSPGCHHVLEKQLAEQGILGALERITADLEQLSSAAATLREDPQKYYRLSGHHGPSQNAASPIRTDFWPRMLETWFRFHGDLKLSESGPLMQFLTLAHRHAGLPPPDYPSLRHARRVLEAIVSSALQVEKVALNSGEEWARAQALETLRSFYPVEG
jgi:hypothetical protein